MNQPIPATATVLSLQLTGKLTKDDVARFRSAMDDKLKQPGDLGACIDVTGLSDISADGLAAGVQADMEMLAHIGRFKRLAFVSDKEWPGAVVGMLSSLLGGIEAKAFAAAQRDEAVQWASQVPAKTAADGGAAQPLRLVPTSRDDVLAFEIDGVLSGGAIKGVIAQVDDFLAKHEKVRMLGRIRHLGIDPSVFMQSGLMSMKFAAMQKVERYAIVGAPGWMAKAVHALDPMFTDIEMRTFTPAEEAQAWEWIGAKPAS